MEILFIGLVLVLIAGLALAVFNMFDALLDYYGGVGGTIISLLITVFFMSFICWLVGFIIPLIDYKLGFILGPIYFFYCWIFGKENRLVEIWFSIF